MALSHDLSGTVQPGRGLAVGLLADRELAKWFADLAGFPIVPGTLNVQLPRALERGPKWRYLPAAEITPDWEARTGQAGYFLVPVLIESQYRGLAFQAVEPEPPGYPADQIELLSEVHLRTALGLSDGDPINVSVRDL